ncbi:MAG TPA: hypothetical protein VKX96_15890 [Chloroflexota bacterium]|nr:hypothetical protein [Chloroflexota bacterium]
MTIEFPAFGATKGKASPWAIVARANAAKKDKSVVRRIGSN